MMITSDGDGGAEMMVKVVGDGMMIVVVIVMLSRQ